jgi:hypothetical protein
MRLINIIFEFAKCLGFESRCAQPWNLSFHTILQRLSIPTPPKSALYFLPTASRIDQPRNHTRASSSSTTYPNWALIPATTTTSTPLNPFPFPLSP